MSEKKSIALLDEHLINQIAAGEVIEDAASVVKELIENAIDAHASSIEIVTKGGGRSLILVSDNGFGISKDELPLALFRHATSKIQSINDLFSLETFGFRGEALASIAAVSHCKILSATKDETGHQLISSAGKISELSIHPRQRGTTIEVRDLFYSVPVRKKFQKNIQSSVKEINKVLMQASFAFPSTSFRWINDGKEEFYLPKERNLLSSVATFFGGEWEENLFAFDENFKLWHLHGLASQPHFSKANRSGQFLFVNGRPIFSPLISQAILEGYGTRLNSGRHPCFVIFLQMPAYQCDVNVHPQKKEIRFQEEKEVYHFVKQSIEKALEKRHAPLPFIVKNLPELPKVNLTFAPLSFATSEKISLEKPDLCPHFLVLAVIGQFILIEKEKRPYLVDAIGVQKRILFEKIQKNDQALCAQTLLFPLTLELTAMQIRTYEKNLTLFQKLKIEMRPIGENYYIIDALLNGIDEKKIYDLLDAIHDECFEKNIAFSLNHLIKRQELSHSEAYQMIKTLFTLENYAFCPEGRPTIIHWPVDEIKRMFL